MKKIKWPIKAKQITSDPQDYNDNNINLLSEQGILPNNHLRGLIQNINKDTDHLVNIYEYSYAKDKLALTNGFYDNILLKNYCDISRKVTEKEKEKFKIAKILFNKKPLKINNKYEVKKTTVKGSGLIKLNFKKNNYSIYFIPIVVENNIVGVIEISELNTILLQEIQANNEILELQEFVLKNNIKLLSNWTKLN